MFTTRKYIMDRLYRNPYPGLSAPFPGILHTTFTSVKKCENHLHISLHNFLVSYTGEKSVAYLAYDGWFGGTAPYGTNLKKNIVKEFKVSGKLKHIMKGSFGNGGSEAILMLKTDGTVAAIYLNEDATDFVLADKLSGIKNIEELREGYNQNGGDNNLLLPPFI